MPKFSFKDYFKPTPKRVRILGDSIAAACTFAASIAVLNGNAMVGTVIMILGWVGKFTSNFFTDGEAVAEIPPPPPPAELGDTSEKKPVGTSWYDLTCVEIINEIESMKEQLTLIKNEKLVAFLTAQIAIGEKTYKDKGCEYQRPVDSANI